MKNKNILIVGLLIIGSIMLLTNTAFAVGTPAGTVIQSRSKVIYTTASGAITDTIYSNYVSLTVAQVAAVNMTPVSNTFTTTGDSVYAVYPLTITNSGNGTDQFTLSTVSSKGWTVGLYYDANGDGSLQPGELSAGTITQSSAFSADSTYKVMVRVFVPRGSALDGQIDTTTVTAVSLFDNAKSNTAQVKTTVNTVNFAGATTGLTVSPTDPSPGQNVTYTYTLNNTGSLPATSVSFSDLVNSAYFTLVSGTTTQGTFNGSGNPATWSAGTVSAGSSVTVTIVLQVKTGIASGTVLSNTINVTYTVGGNTFTVTSNSPYAAAGAVHNVSMNPSSLSSTKEPEDTLVYAMTVKNTGNAKDILELSYSSSKSFSWTFYKDVNGDGLLDGGDTPLTTTAGSPAGVDVDSVAASDSVKILARMIVPVVTTDQDQDSTTFTVTSAADNSKSQSATATTTIDIPVLSIVRSITPSGNQPPGQEMEFVVTFQNTGHGKAYNVVITEDEPDSMTYVANSTTIDNVAKTDAADADAVTVTTAGSKKKITITLGTVNALSAQGTIRYKATIQ